MTVMTDNACMVIEARFSSICPKCSHRIQPRESVEWSKGSPACHINCQAQAVRYDAAGAIVGHGMDADDKSYDAWLEHQTQLAECGVYVLADDTIVRIKMNLAGTGNYANVWQHISGFRLTEAVDPETLKNVRSQGDYQYAPQLKADALASRKMTRDEALRFSTLYGICAWCGRQLKAAKSVERGIGPVCIKRFPEGTTAADLVAAPAAAPVATVAQENVDEVAYDNGSESIVFKGTPDYDVQAWMARKGYTR